MRCVRFEEQAVPGLVLSTVMLSALSMAVLILIGG